MTNPNLVEDDMRRIRRHGREINPGASQTANRCEEVLNEARPIVFDEVKAPPDVKAVDDDRRRAEGSWRCHSARTRR